MLYSFGLTPELSKMVCRSSLQIFLCLLLCGVTLAYTPIDSYLIACGSATNVSVNGRVYAADNPNSLASGGVVGSTTPSNSNLMYPSLLSTARFFVKNSTYTFKVATSRYWVRLYFYPFASATFAPNNSFFSLTANQFVLLDNFSSTAFTTVDKPQVFLEYLVNVTAPNNLVLTFSPMPNSYAYINAIEVLSMPDDQVVDDGTQLGTATVTALGLPSSALQTMYRLNVGGAAVVPLNDSAGIYRTWVPDDNNIFSAATGAPGQINPSLITYPATVPRYSYDSTLLLGAVHFWYMCIIAQCNVNHVIY